MVVAEWAVVAGEAINTSLRENGRQRQRRKKSRDQEDIAQGVTEEEKMMRWWRFSSLFVTLALRRARGFEGR